MYKTKTRFRAVDWSWLAVVPATVLILFFLFIPAALGFLSSFTNYSRAGANWQWVGLANYQRALSGSTFGAALTNGLVLTGLSVPIEVGLGLGLAGLLRRPFRGRSLIRVLLLTPWLISPIAAGVMWHFLFDGKVGLTGWVNAWLGSGKVINPLARPEWALPALALIEVWRMTPFAAFLLLPGVQAVPQDDFDYARLTGIPLWTTWRVVVVPRLWGLLLTVLLLLIAQTLTEFDTVLILTGGGPGQRTVTPALYGYNLAVQGQSWPQGTAIAWMLAGLILVVGGIYGLLLRGERE